MVDDIYQGVNQVVRGADLLSSYSRQQYLIRLLAPVDLRVDYLHAPLMLDSKGNRLAKRDGSESIGLWRTENKTAEQLVAYLYNSLGGAKVGHSISLVDLLHTLSHDSFKGLWVG